MPLLELSATLIMSSIQTVERYLDASDVKMNDTTKNQMSGGMFERNWTFMQCDKGPRKQLPGYDVSARLWNACH